MSKISLSPNASGSATFTIAAPATNTDRTLTLPDGTTTLVGTNATQTLTNKTIQGGTITSATAVSASGTSIDFTGIPSWVKRITVMFNGVSTNGTSSYLVQLGDSGGIETTGYVSTGTGTTATAGGTVSSTSGYIVRSLSASAITSGQMVITLLGSNQWCSSHVLSFDSTAMQLGAGTKTLSDTLTQVRITTVNGTDTFDAGTINILYEG